MSFLKNLLNSVKSLMTHEGDRAKEDGISKQRSTIADYQCTTGAQQSKSAEENTTPSNSPQHTTQNTVHQMPKQQTQLTEVSDVLEHPVVMSAYAKLDVLGDSLGINRRRIVWDRGVLTIPFDASGCDFETKWQLAQASAHEYNIDIHTSPNNIACTEVAKRAFSGIKASREESFICGNMMLTINQDIDDDGYMLAEVTNTHNGNSVFFDIPAAITEHSTIDVDYNLISANILIARNKINA